VWNTYLFQLENNSLNNSTLVCLIDFIEKFLRKNWKMIDLHFFNDRDMGNEWVAGIDNRWVKGVCIGLTIIK
jgi:hypothetical protein